MSCDSQIALTAVSVERSLFTVNLFCFSHVANGLFSTIFADFAQQVVAADGDGVLLPSWEYLIVAASVRVLEHADPTSSDRNGRDNERERSFHPVERIGED